MQCKFSLNESLHLFQNSNDFFLFFAFWIYGYKKYTSDSKISNRSLSMVVCRARPTCKTTFASTWKYRAWYFLNSYFLLLVELEELCRFNGQWTFRLCRAVFFFPDWNFVFTSIVWSSVECLKEIHLNHKMHDSQ